MNAVAHATDNACEGFYTAAAREYEQWQAKAAKLGLTAYRPDVDVGVQGAPRFAKRSARANIGKVNK